MPVFITRVELHGADSKDYEYLHEQMLAANFYRYIMGDDGNKYIMPTAEYHSFSDSTAAQIRDLAMRVASQTGRANWVFVTEASSMAWSTQQA